MADTFREFGKGLIDPKYCCCAVPLVNFGIYAIMGEQLLVGVGIGVAALSTPKVLGASFPSFATYIFAISCFIVGGLQPVGFIGVMREKTKTFKTYIWLDLFALIAAFATSGALIVVSALNHSQAVNSCLINFFKPKPNATSSAVTMLQQQGPLICGPFAWASIGIMGGLWVLFLLLQGYFFFLTKGYSSSQVKDHKLYHSVYSENPEAFTMSILQSKRYNPNSIYNAGPGPSGLARPATLMRDDTWDVRGSGEMDRHGMQAEEIEALQHHQHQSQQVYGQHRHPADYGQQQEQHQYDQYNNAYGTPQEYHHYDDTGRYDDAYSQQQQQQQQYDQRHSAYGGAQGYGYGSGGGGGGGVEQPAEARYGREPGPTPELNQYSAGQGVGFAGAGGLSRPGAVQNHPAEGMFGRKSPRAYQ